MSNGGCEVHRIVWPEALPALRLFRAFHMAKRPSRIFVALLACCACYLVGRLLDGIWVTAGWGLPAEAVLMGISPDATAFPSSSGTAAVGPFAALLQAQATASSQLVRSGVGATLGLDATGLLASAELLVRSKLAIATQRPLYMLLFGLLCLAALSLASGAIARQVAVEVARREHISMFDSALPFARKYWSELFLAPLYVGGVVLCASAGIYALGLVGAIPAIGELFVGLALPLALFAGFVLALVIIGSALGFHLMWPTIVIEASDKFDAVSHAFSYVGRRPWHLGFYALLLAAYGGVCFAMVRLIAFLALKCTHMVLAAAMGLGGAKEGLSKLDRMWSMPGWNELSLLPSPGAASFYGTFFNAQLGMTERAAGYLVASWVYLAVGFVAALALSFWVCGSVQMYFLLRRDVDRMDYNEIFFEEAPLPDEFRGTATAGAAPGPAGSASSSSGTSLPVIPEGDAGERES